MTAIYLTVALLMFGSVFSGVIRNRVIRIIGIAYNYAMGAGAATGRGIQMFCGMVLWALVILILLLTYGIASNNTWIVTIVLVASALPLLLLQLALGPLAEALGTRWKAAQQVVERLLKPISAIVLWIFFFAFLSRTIPSWFHGNFQKTAVLGTALLFFSAMATYLQSKTRFVPYTMAAIVGTLLFLYFFQLQAPNTAEAMKRWGSAEEERTATAVHRSAIRTETEARMTMARLTEESTLYNNNNTAGEKIPAGMRVALVSHKAAPTPSGAEQMVKVILPDANGDFGQAAKKGWLPARKIQLESPFEKESAKTTKESAKTAVQAATSRRTKGVFLLPADGAVVDETTDGNELWHEPGDYGTFRQLTSPPSEFEVVNQTMPNLKIGEETYTSGRCTNREKTELRATGGKEIKIEVTLLP